ncbi:hypothetical protein KRMM14A1259_47020 [Krasilnikovia sp. MM14-A1259]
MFTVFCVLYVKGAPARTLAPHWRRNGFATWLFQPAVTGRYPRKAPHPVRPVPIVGEPWPGVPIRGRGALAQADACWLPIANGLTPHGLRHSYKTLMVELGTPATLMDAQMGHEDGSVQARYAHVTSGMTARLLDGLTQAWTEALAARRELTAITDAGAGPAAGGGADMTLARSSPRFLPRAPENEKRAPSRRNETRSDLQKCVVGDTGIEPVTSSVSSYDLGWTTSNGTGADLGKQSARVHSRPAVFSSIVTQLVTHDTIQSVIVAKVRSVQAGQSLSQVGILRLLIGELTSTHRAGDTICSDAEPHSASLTTVALCSPIHAVTTSSQHIPRMSQWSRSLPDFTRLQLRSSPSFWARRQEPEQNPGTSGHGSLSPSLGNGRSAGPGS